MENGINTDTLINHGLSKCRQHNSPFMPSIGQFVSWCKELHAVNHPPLEVCMAEINQFVRNGRKDTYSLSPFMYHTVTRNLDLYNYKLMEREYDRVKAFEVAYKATIFQLETGNELATPPAPNTLLESKPEVVNAPENAKKASAVISDLLSMFDTPEKEAKPLSKADIEDLQRLEKIQNEN